MKWKKFLKSQNTLNLCLLFIISGNVKKIVIRILKVAEHQVMYTDFKNNKCFEKNLMNFVYVLCYINIHIPGK